MNSDDNLNPGRKHIDETTDFLKRAETNSKLENSDQLENIDDIKNAEENPTWRNNVVSTSDSPKTSNVKFKAFLKKYSPVGALGMSFLGIGVGIITLTSPSLLLLQLREVLTDKFNTQLTSLQKRTNSMYTNKFTTGACTKIVIACKYSTFSEKQLTNFKNAGFDIEVTDASTKTLTGRSKITSITFEGEKISAAQFNSKLNTDLKFRSAVRVAYNPKLASFSDKIFNKVASRFKVSKLGTTVSGDTEEARVKSIQDEVNNKTSAKRVKVGDLKEDGTHYTESDSDLEEINRTNQLADEADQLAKDGKKAASGILDAVDDGVDINIKGATTLAGFSGALGVTGTAEMACSAKNSLYAISTAAKTIRAAQLAKFSMIFLTAADQIKAGKADPNTISTLGKILTTTKKGSNNAAMDSAGVKLASFGDIIPLPTSSSQYIAGGGFAGKLSKFNSMVDNMIAGVPGGITTCKVLTNPIYSVGSLVVGIGMFFVPGVNIAWSAKEIAQIGTSAALAIGAFALPAMLSDIIAGNLIDENTVGESAGDAITSGASGMMGSVAHAGGNAPMTPSQAVAYNNDTQKMLAQEAAEERLAYGQFDITNSNTFLGKLALNITPYITKLSSVSGIFNSLTSITFNSFASISAPISNAAGIEEYTMCQDSDYRTLGYATDPFCNIYYGIPVSDLSSTPSSTAELLYNQIQKGVSNEEGKHEDIPVPQINEETGDPIDKYQEFVSVCIEKNTPFKATPEKELRKIHENDGKSGANVKYTDEDCVYGKDLVLRSEIYHYVTSADGKSKRKVTDWRQLSISNKDFYIHYMDQRLESMMDNI